MARVPARRAAAARPGHAVPARLAHDRVAAAVRRDLRDHARRRAAAVDDRHRVLPLPAGLQPVPRRLCDGDRVRALPCHGGDSGGAVLGRSKGGALPMSSRLRLPFSPWHLVLVPVALIMAAPFFWM